MPPAFKDVSVVEDDHFDWCVFLDRKWIESKRRLRVCRQGLVRFLGISNCYDPKEFEAIYSQAKVKPSVLQNRCVSLFGSGVSRRGGTMVFFSSLCLCALANVLILWLGHSIVH